MPKAVGQDQQRYTEIFVDQFKREYLANCEIATGDPVDLKPYNWTAPIAPAWARDLFLPPCDDHSVVRMVKRVDRNRKGYQIFIDCQAWIDKNIAFKAQWQERLDALVREHYKDSQFSAATKAPPNEILRYVGAPPFPPIEFIQAMAAGNDWALGRSDVIPAKALDLLESIKPIVLAMRGPARLSVTDRVADPFADGGPVIDDDEDEGAVAVVDDPFAPGGHLASADRYADLEEQFDPAAVGGTKVIPSKRGRHGAHAKGQEE